MFSLLNCSTAQPLNRSTTQPLNISPSHLSLEKRGNDELAEQMRYARHSLYFRMPKHFDFLIVDASFADLVRKAVGFSGEIEWDTSRPDGTPRKLLDVTRIRALGWKPRIDLERGIREVYKWFLENSEYA